MIRCLDILFSFLYVTVETNLSIGSRRSQGRMDGSRSSKHTLASFYCNRSSSIRKGQKKEVWDGNCTNIITNWRDFFQIKIEFLHLFFKPNEQIDIDVPEEHALFIDPHDSTSSIQF